MQTGAMRHCGCAIVPPFILESLATCEDAALAGRARATLRLDESLRSRRAPGLRPRGAGRRRPARDDGRTPNRSVHDAGGTTRLPGALVRAEGDPPTDDRSANEAFDGLGHTWQLLARHLGRDSLDGRGMALVATVHFGRRYVNAFWDGEQMVFGDGDGEVFGSFTASLDVIAHELAHGVTQYTSGLHYADQSGALNEHVSDVFGAVVAQYALGQDAREADWLIGADLLLPSVKGVALRSMSAPGTAYDDPRLGRDPQPDRMSRYVQTTDDNGGVHINSGIPNRAFHLVATTLGGPSWLAPAQIWYDAITGDIKADCDFVTFAALTLAAAGDRYGDRSREADAVAAAWQTVEVTGSPSDRPPTVDPLATGGGGPDAARVSVRRSGGFAGIVRERTVTLDDLPSTDAAAWRRLLASNTFQSLQGGEPRPDAFCYGVRCARPPVDVTVPETALPHHVRDLLERTLEP